MLRRKITPTASSSMSLRPSRRQGHILRAWLVETSLLSRLIPLPLNKPNATSRRVAGKEEDVPRDQNAAPARGSTTKQTAGPIIRDTRPNLAPLSAFLPHHPRRCLWVGQGFGDFLGLLWEGHSTSQKNAVGAVLPPAGQVFSSLEKEEKIIILAMHPGKNNFTGTEVELPWSQNS